MSNTEAMVMFFDGFMVVSLVVFIVVTAYFLYERRRRARAA